MLVDKTDDKGRALRVRLVHYRTQVSGKKGPVMKPVPTERHRFYRYSGPDDMLGELKDAE
jgi:hypothetical protein